MCLLFINAQLFPEVTEVIIFFVQECVPKFHLHIGNTICKIWFLLVMILLHEVEHYIYVQKANIVLLILFFILVLNITL